MVQGLALPADDSSTQAPASEGPAPGRGFDARYGALVGLACLVFVAFWVATLDTSFTHDEVVYLDVAEHLFESSFYPGEVFLRHPPLGLAMLAAWTELGLAARAWPLVWTLGGLLVLGEGIRRRGGSPAWLFPAVLAAPVALPLVSVTLYPPLFFFLCLAAWGWAGGRRDVEVVGWNLAVFTHELALLVLAFVLLPRALRLARERSRDLRAWARLVWPYPAAVAWGLVMIVHLLRSADGRGSYLATLADPSPNVASILALTPWVGLVVLLTLLPFLQDPRREASPADRGLLAATVAAVAIAPFYRYALPLVPALAVLRAGDPPPWWDRWGPKPIVLASLLVSALAVGATVTGQDTLNAGNVPGLIDHEEAAALVAANETVVVRSSPSFAHALGEEGWRIQATADTGPATVELSRGEQWIVLQRAETYERIEEIEEPDAVVFPSTWTNVPEDLPAGPWTRAGEAGGATRWEPG